jgi:16S rRNA (guanine(966)-N(2))-methyltransferase RsmD
MTRVVAGIWRGRRLQTPPARDRGVRPTSDRAKTVLFDILGSLEGIPWVVDLFAGTGSLGIEALSRGVEQAGFVERDPRTAALLRDNLDRLQARDRSRVVVRPALAAIRRPAPLPETWPLVLADPPYGAGTGTKVLEALDREGRVAPGGRVVVEHDSEDTPPDAMGTLRLARRRVLGGTTWSIYGVGGDSSHPQPGGGKG